MNNWHWLKKVELSACYLKITTQSALNKEKSTVYKSKYNSKQFFAIHLRLIACYSCEVNIKSFFLCKLKEPNVDRLSVMLRSKVRVFSSTSKQSWMIIGAKPTEIWMVDGKQMHVMRQ